MRHKALAVSVALSLSLAYGNLTFAEEAPNQTIGRVTAAFGVATISSPTAKRPGDLYATVNNKERITTDGGGVSVLLSSRVVLKVDAASSVIVNEGDGQTNIILDYGSVHVYVGRRPVTAGRVYVQSPQLKTEAESGGVYLVSYDKDSKSSYCACEHSTLKLETLDGAAGDGQTHRAELAADTQAIMADGKLQVAGLDRSIFEQRMKSLDQLGQSAIEHGAETFRVRTREQDMATALTQLSAAGWIKGSEFVASSSSSGSSSSNSGGQPQAAGASAKTDKNGKTTVDSPKASSAAETPALSLSTSGSNSSSGSSGNTATAPPSDPLVISSGKSGGVSAPPPAVESVVKVDTKSAPPAINVTPPPSAPPVTSAPPPSLPPVSAPPVTAPPSTPPPSIEVTPPGGDIAKDIKPPKDVVPPLAPPPVTPPPVAPPPVAPPPPIDLAGKDPTPPKVEPPPVIAPPPVAPPVASVAPPPVAPPVAPPPPKVEPPPPPKIEAPPPAPAPPPVAPPVAPPPPAIEPPKVEPPPPPPITPPPPAPVVEPAPAPAPPPPTAPPPPAVTPPPPELPPAPAPAPAPTVDPTPPPPVTVTPPPTDTTKK
jgi:hypothetical protein